MKDDHDDLVFLEEHPAQAASGARNVWRVMIIDDDEDVHSTTTFALGNLDMQHRPLEFVHAYSAGQAREMLKHEAEIAVILLDVVMEQDDAGLHLTVNGEARTLAVDHVIICAGQESERSLHAQLIEAGIAADLIGGADVAEELDALRAIDQGTRVARAL